MSCIEPGLHQDAGKRVLDCLKEYGRKEGASRFSKQCNVTCDILRNNISSIIKVCVL